LSTPALKPDSEPKWKQEVNQRLAAHRSRKGDSAATVIPPAETPSAAGSRAAQAAARVAARYAQAPSYSQMLAEEARAAVRAAEAASYAAIEAQAVAESVLAGLEAATGKGPAWEPEFSRVPEPPQPHAPVFFDPFFTAERSTAVSRPKLDREPVEIRWDPDMPVAGQEPRAARAPSQPQHDAAAHDDWRGPVPIEEALQAIEPARPIHANIIQFPRELVAARKARPRIADGPAESERTGQLSIFEVDPGAISIEPVIAETAAEPVVADWAQIRLNAEPEFHLYPEPAPAPLPALLPVAPVGFRVMAGLVDGALIGAAFLVTALFTAMNMHRAPAARSIEMEAVAALLVVGVLYQAVFFAFSEATPGMRYAGISLCTFDGHKPDRDQRFRRIGALLLSVLPVGLGLLWAIFDEGHLSWHDRLSATYQRKG
jgi:uncharacterized RDD family membrane protein YckC